MDADPYTADDWFLHALYSAWLLRQRVDRLRDYRYAETYSPLDDTLRRRNYLYRFVPLGPTKHPYLRGIYLRKE